MVVDSKQLISDIVLDTDNKMHKQCKFCGKLLHINDYTALYVNIVYKDIATAYERCTCDEASKIWQQYDEYIEKSLPSCKDCWTVQMCALCYMYCYNKDGIDMDRKRLSCERIKFLNERSLVRYHELLENNPQGLKNLLNLEYN